MDKEQWGKFLDDIAVIRRLTEDNHKAIFGDGKPGLIERVTKLETQAETAVWGIRAFCAVVGYVVGKVLDVIAQRLAG